MKATGAACDRDAIVHALEGGQLASYAGMSGFRSRLPLIVLGGRCPTTA